MKRGFYRTLASTNLRKNSRFYFPHILTGAGLLACFYIMLTLAMDSRLSQVKGGSYIGSFLFLGAGILAILSVVLMLYTNSFLMRQRKNEYGLYNILGMEKKHVCKVLYHEMLLSCGATIVLGLIVGMLFYKMCSLIICGLLHVDSVAGFYFITPKTLIPSALFFILIYLVTYLINRISVNRMKPVELLNSKKAGAKEPKIRWVFLVVGIVTLALGYYFAITTESPLRALNLFFTAVILVVIGTYCIFVAGTVTVLKFLKKRGTFYYHPKRMVAVSGLVYRMNQNAVGLASITILATCVLVLVSSTISLYAGMEDNLEKSFPTYQLYFSAHYGIGDGEEEVEIPFDVLAEIVESAGEENGVPVEKIDKQTYLTASYLYRNDELITDQSIAYSENEIAMFVWMTEETYNSLSDMPIDLQKGEIAYTPYNLRKSLGDTLTVAGTTYQVVEDLTRFPIKDPSSNVVDVYGVVVPEEADLQQIYNDQKQAYGENASEITEQLAVQFQNEQKLDTVGDDFMVSMGAEIQNYIEDHDGNGGYGYFMDSKWETKENMFGLYGTLLFLGLILGFVCMFATALIIYYKQISEGYEDRRNFQIMEKIGMSAVEVQKTIRSQILMVFFLPLIITIAHISAASPLLIKILRLMMLPSALVYIKCALIAVLIFVIIYIVIYGLTAKMYYRIVHRKTV